MDPMQTPNNLPQNPGVPQGPQDPLESPAVPVVPQQPVVPPPAQPFGMQPQPAESPLPTAMPQQSPMPQPPQPMNNPFNQAAGDPFASQQPQFIQPDFTPPSPSSPSWKRFIKPAIIVIIAIVVIVGGYFVYTALNSKAQKTATTNSTNQVVQSTKSNVPEINTLKNFTLSAPQAALTQGMTSTQAQAATQLTSADDSCTLIYGIETQTQLPGTDIGSVISQYLAKLKQQSPHIVINGPNAARALVLEGTDGNSYSLPTVNFTYTDSSQAGAANGVYSVSQLSNGSHAVVAVICGSDTAKTPADLQSKVSTLQNAAASIKVQIQ